MTDTYLEHSFHAACKQAKPRGSHFVSLYEQIPFYGGPEEGGWWGSDTRLVASQEFATRDAADAARGQVDAIAKQASEDAKDAYGQQCLDELARCDERGEDVDALPEVDGEAEFFVIVEERSGQAEERGDRHWE